MRIISGKHRGRRIESPKGKTIRPTTDRCREALFNLLMHGPFEQSPVIDQHVMDLCCGTGALGLEALSRGAVHCSFVDSNRTSLDLARFNAQKFNELEHAEFLCTHVSHLPAAKTPVTLVMMDAPYHSGLIAPAFKALRAQGWLAPGTILAFEYDHKEAFPDLPDTELIREREYGKTKINVVKVVKQLSS